MVLLGDACLIKTEKMPFEPLEMQKYLSNPLWKVNRTLTEILFLKDFQFVACKDGRLSCFHHCLVECEPTVFQTFFQRESRSAWSHNNTAHMCVAITKHWCDVSRCLRRIATQEAVEELETVFGDVVVKRMRVVSHLTHVSVRLFISRTAER